MRARELIAIWMNRDVRGKICPSNDFAQNGSRLSFQINRLPGRPTMDAAQQPHASQFIRREVPVVGSKHARVLELAIVRARLVRGTVRLHTPGRITIINASEA